MDINNPHLMLAIARLLSAGYTFVTLQPPSLNLAAGSEDEIFDACEKVGVPIESIPMLKTLLGLIGFTEETTGYFTAPERWLDDIKAVLLNKFYELLKTKPSLYKWRGEDQLVLRFGREQDAVEDLAGLGVDLKDFATVYFALMLIRKSYHGPEGHVGNIWELLPVTEPSDK